MSELAETPASDAPASRKPRLRLLVLLPLIVFGGLAALFFTRLVEGDPSRVPSALIGRAVPAFDLPPLEGLSRDGAAVPGLATADLKAGKVMLVNVWASWCGPCRQEHPLLVQLAKDSRVEVVGINYKDTPENARRFLGALGNPFSRVGADINGRVGIDWGVYGVPETFVVAGDGTIRHKHIGPLTPEALATTFAAAIAEASAIR